MVALAIEEAREAADGLLDAVIIEKVGDGVPSGDRVERARGYLMSSVGALCSGHGGNEGGSSEC